MPASAGLTGEVARLLTESAELADGRIAHYQIVVPTSWNFSPRDAAGTPGALETALVGVTIDSSEGRGQSVAVQHTVRSFDPCMVWSVH